MTRTRRVCTEHTVLLPAALRHCGETVQARVAGPESGPVIVVLGGISGDRFVCGDEAGGKGWWPGLVGDGRAVDPARHRVVAFDFAADETGRVAPSTDDQARVVGTVLDAIGAAKADALIGASYGGMVGLSLAQHFPDRIGRLVVISAGAEPHAAATAVRELQRRVVALGLANGNAAEALSIARGMAMLSYRTADEFAARFDGGLPDADPLGPSEPGRYLHARGKAFQAVMSPRRFLSLSGSIDRHRIDPSRITTPTLLIGASSDQLVLPAQMRSLADRLAGPAELHLLDCLYGHDMFLKEAEKVGALIAPFLEAA